MIVMREDTKSQKKHSRIIRPLVLLVLGSALLSAIYFGVIGFATGSFKSTQRAAPSLPHHGRKFRYRYAFSERSDFYCNTEPDSNANADLITHIDPRRSTCFAR